MRLGNPGAETRVWIPIRQRETGDRRRPGLIRCGLSATLDQRAAIRSSQPGQDPRRILQISGSKFGALSLSRSFKDQHLDQHGHSQISILWYEYRVLRVS